MRLTWMLLLPLLWLAACRQPVPSGDMAAESQADPVATRLRHLSDSIAADSLDAGLYNRRAQVFLSQDRVNEALADINVALALDPDYAGYFVTLSDIYLEMKSIAKAKEALNKASDLDPLDPLPCFKQGYLHLLIQDHGLAAEYFKKAVGLQPVYPQAYFHLGITSLETGDTSQAIGYIQTAVQQDQSLTDGFIVLGSLLSSGDPALAAAYYRQAVRIDPANPQVMYNLGMLLQEAGDDPEAEEIYLKILSLDSSYFLASYNLGYIYMVRREEYTRAIRFFDHAIRINPSYVDAWYNRGLCCEILGDLPGARSNYQEALRLLPDYPRAVEGLNRLDE